ncbi:MAG: hypothetical protein H0T78_09295 [Longispora sp.]|nr:hypothetical protein [Longispora sp. (in: high G+C Gram-positive bacteria)]
MSTNTSTASAPGIGVFLRLKFRILNNTLSGGNMRVLLFVCGAMGGAVGTVFGFISIVSIVGMPENAGYAMASIVGSVFVLGWFLLPLVYSGVDETLQPNRFAMIPIRRRALLAGLLAAAFLGIPAFCTFAASMAFVIIGFILGGPVGGITALVGIVLGAVLCVVASRAVTSGFAAALRSRKAKDHSAVLSMLSVVMIWPMMTLPSFLFSAEHGATLAEAAAILRWSPFAAPYVAWYDITLGDVWLGVAKLAGTVAVIALLLWWWSQTIDSAKLATSKNSGSVKKVKGLPLGLFGRAPDTVFGAIMAVNIRMFWRDPRRRSALVASMGLAVVLPLIWTVTGDGVMLALLGSWIGINLVNTLVANQFGYDGAAYGLHVATGVRARTEFAVRTCVFALFAIPLSTVVVVTLGFLDGQSGRIIGSLGVTYAAIGVTLGAMSIMSVYAPYSLPPSTNPFAMNTGGCAAALPQLVSMFVVLVMVAPFGFISWSLEDSLWSIAMLPIGLLYGLGITLLGTWIAAKRLDARAPEVLDAVTHR